MDTASRRRYGPDVIAAGGLLVMALVAFRPAPASDVVLFERDIMVRWPPILECNVVGRSRVVPDADTALAQLLDPAFEPRRDVVLAAGDPLLEPEPFQGSARVVARSFRRVAIEVEASRPGYLVLVESFVPGWRATVAGASVPVLGGNAAVRAIRVPAGVHRVEMSYLLVSVVIGVLTSATAVLAALVVWTRSSRPHPAGEALPA